MTRVLQAGVILCVCLVAGLCITFLQPESGQAQATSSLENTDANQLLKMIGANKGKVVVVNIFASWCPPCREEIPGLIAVRKAFQQDQLALVGVSVDKTPQAIQQFMKEYSFNYPVYLATGNFEATLGISAIPQLLIYNKAGELVINHKGLVQEADLKKAVEKLLAE